MKKALSHSDLITIVLSSSDTSNSSNSNKSSIKSNPKKYFYSLFRYYFCCIYNKNASFDSTDDYPNDYDVNDADDAVKLI